MHRASFHTLWVLAILSFGTGCQTAFNPSLTAWDGMTPERQRVRIVASAEELARYREFRVAHRRFSRDCSGYVGAVLLQNGIDVYRGASELDIRGNGVRLLSEFVGRYGTVGRTAPETGDLVFFSNTYDRNHDGKTNDRLTHVGIVERVDPDGTVVFLHYLHGKVRRYALNLSKPSETRDDSGKVVNSYLRRRRRRDPRGMSYLAAGLFDSFGSLVKTPVLTPPEPSSTPAPESTSGETNDDPGKSGV